MFIFHQKQINFSNGILSKVLVVKRIVRCHYHSRTITIYKYIEACIQTKTVILCQISKCSNKSRKKERKDSSSISICDDAQRSKVLVKINSKLIWCENRRNIKHHKKLTVKSQHQQPQSFAYRTCNEKINVHTKKSESGIAQREACGRRRKIEQHHSHTTWLWCVDTFK